MPFIIHKIAARTSPFHALPVAKLTDSGHLQHLALMNTKVTDAGLEHLNGLIKLESLFLEGTQVTDEGVEKLQQALPKCKILH